MRIVSLTIENFRGISSAQLSSLDSMVVIAGTNGSGKSTVFDALRLLKSVYGSPNRNEPEQWFGEFQMPLSDDPDGFAPLFHDKTKTLSIRAAFSLSESERAYLRENSRRLVQVVITGDWTGNGGRWLSLRRAALSRTVRHYPDQLETSIVDYEKGLLEELERDTYEALFEIQPRGVPHIPASNVLETVFSTYEPEHLGGLRYHSAQRNYTREQLQNVAINVVEGQNRDVTSYLYGNAQYTNIKQEMAAAYVKELVAKDAGVTIDKISSVSETLKELFRRFFPDKEFLGPRPNESGNVHFPVRVSDNSSHDLDDLSSGEKEIVYGYLRMRNLSPKDSVILIDEPELHLNPILISSLPDFYHKYLGQGRGNQLWLVTHSDALLREALGKSDFSVYHMLPPTADEASSGQAVRLRVDEEANNAIIHLVGDLAAYRPGSKLIIFEGGGDSQFDVQMTTRLFPKIAVRMNFISGGNKLEVRQMHAAIEASDPASDIFRKVYSIVDGDNDDTTERTQNRYRWPRYHIENYLLEPKYLARIIRKSGVAEISEDDVLASLVDCARETMGHLVRHELSEFISSRLLAVIEVSASPEAQPLFVPLAARIAAMPRKLSDLEAGELSSAALEARERDVRHRLESDLSNGKWIRTFKGRDVLKRFFGKHLRGTTYDVAVHWVLSEMADDEFQPDDMKSILDRVSAD